MALGRAGCWALGAPPGGLGPGLSVSAFSFFFPESGNKMLAFTGRIPGCANGACAVRAAVSQPLLSYTLVSYPKCVLWDLGLGLCLFSCASVSTTSSFPLGEGTFLTAHEWFRYSSRFHGANAVGLREMLGISFFFSLPLMASSKSFMHLSMS